MARFDYNVEPTLETALVSLLNGQGLTAGGSLTTDTLTNPRIDVRFELGAERDSFSAAENVFLANTWEGHFVLSVITDRDNTDQNHSAYRATVRQVLAESTAAQWEAVLGSHFRLLSLNHQGTVYNVLDNDLAIDASVMTYSVILRFL